MGRGESWTGRTEICWQDWTVKTACRLEGQKQDLVNDSISTEQEDFF